MKIASKITNLSIDMTTQNQADGIAYLRGSEATTTCTALLVHRKERGDEIQKRQIRRTKKKSKNEVGEGGYWKYVTSGQVSFRGQ